MKRLCWVRPSMRTQLKRSKSTLPIQWKKGRALPPGASARILGGSYFELTVLTDVPREALIFSDETFRPVAPLFRFDTEDEAIAKANDNLLLATDSTVSALSAG